MNVLQKQRTLVHLAVRGANTKTLQYLVGKGAKVNVTDEVRFLCIKVVDK